MRFVKLTKEQALQMTSKQVGVTSGKRDKITGERPIIRFCTSLDFIKKFGCEIEREFIEI